MQITELPKKIAYDIYLNGFAHAVEQYLTMDLDQKAVRESFEEWWSDLLDEGK